MENRNVLLSVEDLSVSFISEGKEIPTIKNINLHINEGESVSIVGESGSGKTVTCRSMLGLVPTPPAKYTNGSINYEGRNILDNTEEEWRQVRGQDISMVFQNPMTALNPLFTIGHQMENVYIYQGKASAWSIIGKSKRKLKAEAKERALYLLEKMKLPDPEGMLSRYPTQLSGGQRQRIIIALALIHTPKLLIADEPATALDVTVQASINKELVKLVEDEGISMIYITHNLGVAKNISDRIYVMKLGEVVEQGDTKAIFDNPQHPYTQNLLNSIPRLIENPKEAEVLL